MDQNNYSNLEENIKILVREIFIKFIFYLKESHPTRNSDKIYKYNGY